MRHLNERIQLTECRLGRINAQRGDLLMKHIKRKRPGQDEKRRRILLAAIETFAIKGYSLATIAEIAKKADIACGTVYLYFRNKDDLLIQCMHEMMDSKLKEIQEKISTEPSAMERLYLFFIQHIELFTEDPNYARFMVVEVRQSEEFYKLYPSYNPLNKYLDYVQQLVQGAIDEGSIRKVDATAMAYMIIGAMDLVLTQWLIGDNAIDLRQITDNIRNILKSGTNL
jgi:TetR/AcrR family fatty acid metabolism transcriptional regulator